MKKPLSRLRVQIVGHPLLPGCPHPAGVLSIRTLPRKTSGILIVMMSVFACVSWAQIPQADSLERGSVTAPEKTKPERPDSVQARLFNSLAAARTLGNRELELQNLKAIGILLMSQKKIPESEKAFRASMRIAEEIKAKAEIMDIYELLSEVTASRGDTRLALDFHQRFSTIKDSLTAETSRNRLAELNAGYEADRREREKRLFKAESDLRQAVLARVQTTVAAVVAGGLLAGILGLVFFRARRRERRMNRDLADANGRLAELVRYKEGLTDMIAHDLQNPLNGILVHSDGAIDRSGRAIRQAAKQMLNHVLDILDVQKVEEAGIKLNLKNGLLQIPAEQAVEDVRFLADEKGVAIHNDIVSTMAASMDTEIIRRVFVNLLTNTVKFSNPGGEIWMKAIAGGDGLIRVSVNDTGGGIAPDQREKAFEKFGRIETRQSGTVHSTGLGLTFCKLAVEAHGGTISMESEPGKGSSFAFTLAKARIPLNGAPIPSLSSQPDSDSRKPVVLSDSDRKKVKPVLKKLGKLNIFEVGEIRNCLKSIDDRDPALKRWKDDMEAAALACDEARYRELMNL